MCLGHVREPHGENIIKINIMYVTLLDLSVTATYVRSIFAPLPQFFREKEGREGERERERERKGAKGYNPKFHGPLCRLESEARRTVRF